jgi:hypothetical protein
MRKFLLLSCVVALASTAFATVIFQDNFESYTDQTSFEAAWPRIGTTNPTVWTTEQANSATHSIKALTAANSTGGNYHNLGAQYTPTDEQPVTAEWWMYYVEGGTRHYNEIRSYTGGTYGSGTLNQLIAMGWNNNTDANGEVLQGTKFQARVTAGGYFTAGTWFNLNEPNCPTRSAGWHKFTAVMTTHSLNVYVDNVLGRSLTGTGTNPAYDDVVLGSRITSAGIASYTDDFLVSQVPEPAALALLVAGLLLRRR